MLRYGIFSFVLLLLLVACGESHEQMLRQLTELDRMHGLDTYDYGARQYDPVLCRWDRMDPLCEKYYGVSPYMYCAGNPVNAIDLHGDTIKWTQGNETNRQYVELNNLRNQSTVFSTLYNYLDNQPYTITLNVDNKDVQSSFKDYSGSASDTAGGYTQGNKIVFGDNASITTYSEELFHAFQNTCYRDNPRDNWEKDAEAKLFNNVVLYEVGSQEKGIRGIINSINKGSDPKAVYYYSGSCALTLYSACEQQLIVAEGSAAMQNYANYLNGFSSHHSNGHIYSGLQRQLIPQAYNIIISFVK